MPSYTEKRTSDQTLEVDDLTRLIDPALLPLELPAVTPEALLPSSLFESQLFLRREAIAKLIAEDRQLDAFEQALSFAFRILSSCPGFTVRTGRYTYSPGVTFPVIALLFEDWWPDVRMQSSLASDLLSLMLRCYGKSPFPDRVDVRELGVGWSSLVVQYGSDSVGPTGNAGGEIGRVRKKIIEEMRLREI
ncbi:hypothetical protein F5Y10DRAFT_258911 [Nemania abortiva]|nr:hypothetical protein F5Y10DRAFT_258911 [Nemania abortiva]